MTDKSCVDCELMKSKTILIDELNNCLRVANSENKHLKEKIRELEDELDIHHHHIAELESEMWNE